MALPARHAVAVTHQLDPRTLQVTGDLLGIPDELTVLVVPDVADDAGRAQLRRLLSGREWGHRADRADGRRGGVPQRLARGHALLGTAPDGTRRSPDGVPRDRALAVDLDDWLVELVVHADPRWRSPAYARGRSPRSRACGRAREAILETLRAWLLHQGRRADVAAELQVHPQTVRYRMDRARERTAISSRIPEESSS